MPFQLVLLPPATTKTKENRIDKKEHVQGSEKNLYCKKIALIRKNMYATRFRKNLYRKLK